MIARGGNIPADGGGRNGTTVVLAMLDTQRDRLDGMSPVTIGSASAFELLERRVREAGFNFDVWPTGPAPDRHAVVLWDMGSFAVPPLRLRGRRMIAWSLESPLIARRAFRRLSKIAAASCLMLTFPGARSLIDREVNFRPIFYPNRRRNISRTHDWENRELIVMINSNKRAHPGGEMMSWRRPYRTVRVCAARALVAWEKLRGSTLPPDLYPRRLDAIEHFSKVPGFRLYGVGWDHPVVGRKSLSVSQVYGGPVRDKNQVLQSYRFCLCYENAAFPGYITEKMFDCFFAGVIPVYLGAPDVTAYVPPEAFVDVRRFASLGELEFYLRSLDPAVATAYLEAAADFLRSEAFERFTDDWFVNEILHAITHCAHAPPVAGMSS